MKKIVLFCFVLCLQMTHAQTNRLWQGYFSFNSLKDVTRKSSTVYAASENAVFFQKPTDGFLETITTINGLKADNITTIHYSEAYQVLLVGNDNGLLLVVDKDGKVAYKNGILTEVPVPASVKKINHFNEYDGKVYIACDYGISVFDLDQMEFGDTYYIGNGGAQVKVYQTTVYNGFIYAATDSNGIKSAAVTNPFLIDFNQWQVFDSGNWLGIQAKQNQLMLCNTNNIIYTSNGAGFNPVYTLGQTAVDFRVVDNYTVITTAQKVVVLNAGNTLETLVNTSQYTVEPVTFNAAIVASDQLYIATNEVGLLETGMSSINLQVLKPSGPDSNQPFRLLKTDDKLFVTYGKFNFTYNPYSPTPPYQPYLLPINYFTKDLGWSKIPTTDIFDARSLSSVAVNPKNTSETYISSYFSGVLKLEDMVPTVLYNQTNTGTNGLESLVLSPPDPTYVDIRINGLKYDSKGNLWMTNAYVDKGIKVLKTGGQWQSFDLNTVLTEPFFERYGQIQIDKNDTKWIPSYRANGLIIFNENYNNKCLLVKTGTEGNLPSMDVRCVAIDNRNQVWIGTARGLRTISSADTFINADNIQSKAIIINEVIDGVELAQELFYEQVILDICVDGANRKWVSIADSGVYLVSANGQETIFHFTKENSPLPSNNVADIEIDGTTGEVFFATEKGLISYKGTATKPSDDLAGVYVYPNPVRPEYTGTVKIAELTDKAIVKITDIEGNLVYETTASGGTIEWDTTAFGKYRVASGVYMIFISGEDGIETAVRKVMIIR
ncbi:T9SS type A sorting domain-containing protein [Flavobacterium sp. N1719]|uniref:type IX secretion system anionic LPS delivery protein PorZ n=1 Tax=Flavobacterium sp. N1719 TaxID=2885633 RepID=UPI002223CCFF|nr:T9SS type A sorting domain-containing protein [Flavobacterium sp. N1719]